MLNNSLLNQDFYISQSLTAIPNRRWLVTEPVAVERTREDEMKELSRYFYALKEVWRLRMLQALAGADELTVTELAEQLHISQPLLSWHLRRLRQADIVRVRKEGRESFYSLDRQKLAEYWAQFDRLLQP